MLEGVLDEIADHASEQHGIADHLDGLALDRRLEPRPLLCRQAQKIDGRQAVGRRFAVMVEAARKQDLLDELIDLGEVAPNLLSRRGRRIVRRHLDSHSEPGERRA
jgi:hypothetical protein